MTSNSLTISCKKCGYLKNIEKQWVLERFSVDPYASLESIEFHLNKHRKKLRCVKCGAHEAAIMRKDAPIPSGIKSEDYEKRYIDEGIAGSREDNKKMGARQSGTNLSHKF